MADLRQTIARAFASCSAIYNRPVDRALVDIYAAALGQYSPEQVDAAFRRHQVDVERGQFFPKPADLVYQIKTLAPDKAQEAMLAWAEVPSLLRNSRNARSADLITEKVMQDLGGWFSVGQKTADQLVWIEKEFARRYEMYSELGTDVRAISGPRNGLRLIGGEK
jgi:hypothetical protein